jgi:transcriptional regulator with XRE-family HTH domain
MPTPTWSQLVLGHELKRMREDRGLTLAETIEPLLDFTLNKLSRIERGQSSVRASDVLVLLDRYGVDGEEREWALDTAKHCKQRGRWSGHRAFYDKHFRMAVDLEADAELIQQYQVELIPGLLQTPAYMREVLGLTAPQLMDELVENGIRAKLERQEVIKRPNAPELAFILSESAIRRAVASDEIMLEQLQHLAKLATLNNVHIQVLTFRAATHPGEAASSFTTFRIPAPKSGPLEFVYLEDVHDGRYLDDHDSVAAYGKLWARLTGAALGPVESRKLLLQLAAAYT